MWPAIVMAIISAVSAVAQSESNRRQKNYEADVARKTLLPSVRKRNLRRRKPPTNLG